MMTRTFVPIYARILDTLRQRIADGVYRVGESLPTEAELVLEFNVSRQTVRSALQNLVAEGIVERTAGRGTFLKRGGADGGEWNIGGIEDIIDIGFSGAYAVKSVQTVTAARNARIAGVLDVPATGRMLSVRATRSTQRRAVRLLEPVFSGGDRRAPAAPSVRSAAAGPAGRGVLWDPGLPQPAGRIGDPG